VGHNSGLPEIISNDLLVSKRDSLFNKDRVIASTMFNELAFGFKAHGPFTRT